MSYAFVLPPVPRYLRPEDRALIEEQIEALIALLDEQDGDCDLEEDDHSGDPLDQGEAQADTPIAPIQPFYGIDQSLGPINEDDAHRAWRRLLERPL